MLFWLTIIFMAEYITIIAKIDKTYFRLNLILLTINSTFSSIIGFFYALESYKSGIQFYCIIIFAIIIFFSPIYFVINNKIAKSKAIPRSIPIIKQYYNSLISFLVVFNSCILGLYDIFHKKTKFFSPLWLSLTYCFGLLFIFILLGAFYRKQLNRDCANIPINKTFQPKL
jgi:hypothetical protein